jgi:hypothetical protein
MVFPKNPQGAFCKYSFHLTGSECKDTKYSQNGNFFFEKMQTPNPLLQKEKGDISVAQSTLAPRPSQLSKFNQSYLEILTL